jgi:hypothetical protein
MPGVEEDCIGSQGAQRTVALEKKKKEPIKAPRT